ncbi:hypothetical protein GOP47_0004554 [Adiantum capillus-veneris]|uniref:Pentatricopeptide repeat-containing protein n=1 Tax=Adiantum capillus-veneris TaxID=13818 RepID=A0A9D4ZPT3_ADICA|nr:hypothetical protein GOP47_0004554 [Adiantum capillus-veneris]
MQRALLNAHRHGTGHAFADYPSSQDRQINAVFFLQRVRTRPHSCTHATFTGADKKKDKFLLKRLSGDHVSIPRSRIRRFSKDEDVESLDFSLFSISEMCPDTYSAMLRLCAKHSLRMSGMLLHYHIIRDGFDDVLVLQNLFVQMYNECKLMNDASCVFSLIPFRDEFSWNFMIRSCRQNAGVMESNEMFNIMLGEGILPNKFCYTSLLLANSTYEEIAEGKRVLARLIDISFETDTLFNNALLSMCCKCTDLDDATQLFNWLYDWDVVAWNAMIAAYSKQGRGEEAIYYFKQMQQSGVLPNEPTFVSALDACTDGSIMFEGQCLHASFAGTDMERDLVLGTALVNLYGKQGDLRQAQRVFDQMLEQSAVSWNGIITAYVFHSQGKEAQGLFHQMLQQGIMPGKFVLVSMFSAHARKEDLAEGKRLYGRLFGMDFGSDVVVLTAVLNMFCKCGSMEDAEGIFDDRKNPDLVMWTSMIAGYAQHGQGRKALQLYKRMQLEGHKPNQVTYTSVLSACSREGLVDEGVRYLLSMSRDLHIKPSMDHYNCVIDLLARSGRLNEAEELIASMSVEADHVSWTSLLDACRKHSDLERACRATNRVLS